MNNAMISRPLQSLRSALPTWLHASDLQGLAQLGTQAALGVTGVAEVMQGSAYKSLAAKLGRFGERFVDTTPGASGIRPVGLTGFVYGTARGAARLAGGTLNAALAKVGPMMGERASLPPREAMLSAINGVLGDHLQATANPLAITMVLREGGEPLLPTQAELAARPPQAGGKLLLMVHGLCLNDLQWSGANAEGLHDHGRMLARAFGYTPVYLRYNSGLPIDENGRQLDLLLAQLVNAWPQPVQEIAVLAHGMGGLVARSACRHAEVEGQPWRDLLKRMVFLGTPHQGTPMRMLGDWIDTLLGASIVTQPFAHIGRLRSAGITDLQHGAVVTSVAPESGGAEGPQTLAVPLPLPSGVACHAVAGALAAAPLQGQDGPEASARLLMASELLGDGLTPVSSALGESDDEGRALGLPQTSRFVAWQTDHTALLYSPEVAERLRRWFADAAHDSQGAAAV